MAIIRDYSENRKASRKIGAAIVKTGKIAAGILIIGSASYYGGKFAYRCASFPEYAESAAKQTIEFIEHLPAYFKNAQKTQQENEGLKTRLKNLSENSMRKLMECGDKVSERDRRIAELEGENERIRKRPEKLEQKVASKPAAKPAEKKILQKTYFDIAYSTGTKPEDLWTITQAVSVNSKEIGDESENDDMKKARSGYGKEVLQKIPGWTSELTNLYNAGIIDIKINVSKAGKRLIIGHWKDKKTFVRQKEIPIDDKVIKDIISYYNSS